MANGSPGSAPVRVNQHAVNAHTKTGKNQLTLPRLKRVGFLGSPLRPVRASYTVMHGISTVSSSVTSRVPHGSLDVDARLGFRRTRPGDVVPKKILPHIHRPPCYVRQGRTLGSPCIPPLKGMGFIAPPHPLFFINW